MYDALNHFYDNWPGSPARHPDEHKRLEEMKNIFYSMLMEYTLHQGQYKYINIKGYLIFNYG